MVRVQVASAPGWLSSARVSPVRWGASVGITLIARPRVWGEVQGWRRLSVCVCPLHMARVLTSVRLSETQLCSAQVFTGYLLWTLEGGHWADTDKISLKSARFIHASIWVVQVCFILRIFSYWQFRHKFHGNGKLRKDWSSFWLLQKKTLNIFEILHFLSIGIYMEWFWISYT